MIPVAEPGVGKHLFDLFPIRNGLEQGDSLWPLFVNFALEIRH